jgi:ABA4-like protein
VSGWPDAEALFLVANAAVLPGWALLLLAPRWRGTERIVTALPLLLCAAYVVLLVTRSLGAPGGFSSLAAVRLLFDDPYLLLAGWLHYLAFDLFVGGWEARDARALGLPPLLVAPCLLLTLLVGPAGWLAYSVLRAGWRARLTPAAAGS